MVPVATHDLHQFFFPQSIAIVGASRDEKKIGHMILNNIIDGGFSGEVYPVNPRAESIGALSCVATYADIPVIPDLAIVTIPAEAVPAIVEEIAKKGTKNIVIISAGFREVGSEGNALEEKILALADVYNLRILGPNCLGFVNTRTKLNATFGIPLHHFGPLRFISQSGAIASSIFDWSESIGVGLEEVITIGNKATIGENDILAYWATDNAEVPYAADAGYSGYRPIGMYLESIQSGERLVEIASEISMSHPICLLKPGRSLAAKEAMHSHTGALAGEDRILDVACERAGILRCSGVEDLYDITRTFAWVRAPEGPRVAIISNAGGPAVVSTDCLQDAGLVLAPLSQKTRDILSEHLPRAASIRNPIDVLGDALNDRYAAALEAVLKEKTVDAVLVIVTPQIMTDSVGIAEVIGQLTRKHRKPVICSFMGDDRIHDGEDVLHSYHIPSFRFPERAVQILGRIWWWRSWQGEQLLRKKQKRIEPLSHTVAATLTSLVSRVQGDMRTVCTSVEANTIVQTAGILVPPSAVIKTIGDIDTFVRAYGFPVVLKLSSSALVHKQDAGGVITNVRETAQLYHEWDTIKKRAAALERRYTVPVSIQIQKQVDAGVEVIVGVKRDPTFGPVLLIGSGGSFTELYRDTATTILPNTDDDIRRLLSRTAVGTILRGYRGHAPYAEEAVVVAIKRIVQIGASVSAITDIEINPLIVTSDAAYAVDGKVLLV